jgi:hypothetical protein
LELEFGMRIGFGGVLATSPRDAGPITNSEF